MVARITSAALALFALGCVPRNTITTSRMQPAEMYDAARVACAGFDDEDLARDPLASISWSEVRPIRVLEGKARVHRTAGVRLIARVHAPDLERRVSCRMYRLGSYQDDPRAHELLAVPNVEVRIRRARGAIEVHLTSPMRSAGSMLVDRARRL